jgi:hypothetical protein
VPAKDVRVVCGGTTAAAGTKKVALAVTRISILIAATVTLVAGLGSLNGALTQAEAQGAAGRLTPVMVQDFERPSLTASVWVVNIPNENASVRLSTERPGQGKQCLSLHYHFTGVGQYLGVPIPVKVQAPVHKVRFILDGDGSGCSCAIYVTDASGEVHKCRSADATRIDFKGWKEVAFDLDAPREVWGGDKNGKIDDPVTSITFEIGHNGTAPVESDLRFDALRVDSERGVAETLGAQVAVVSPAYCSAVRGNTRVVLAAPGFKSVTARCWKQGPGFGSDSTVATVALDAAGSGAFVFPADAYPHGPLTVRISGENGALKDNCYLQLYNRGGLSWNEGLPKDPPPPAAGMALVFADDFKGPLSISTTDPRAIYFDHKPLGGDFSTLPFAGHDEPRNPFSQVDSYLRIRADARKNSAGLISSLNNEGRGIRAALPCYFECRFLGPNAIGTWPAFWLMTDYVAERKAGRPENSVPVDELDIIEAYGGEGPREPNAFDLYGVTPHAWNQGEAGRAAETQAVNQVHGPVSMKKHGIPSTWFEAFHTYGCKITETDTVYYCDNIEVGRHKTLEASKRYPFFFMVNLATGGGWPVDLSRYDGVADMYVDYVRVYQGKR